ncbi:MAG: glucose 1-dehydrogenase [Caldilineaceae bacterium]|nr:glucose 1-dehydrogenase [Caldilineaceae bacterium]
MADFEGKVVIVTGGAKGIGRAISLAFAREGANVLCADMDAQAGQQIERDSAGLAGTVAFQRADVARANDCQALVNTCVDRWSGLDVIVNNAGIQPASSYLPAHELPEEDWDRILDVNLKSTFLTAKYGVPQMKQRGGGAIVNIASVQGLQSAKAVSAYAASKGGLLNLTRQLALEYAADGIRVNAVNPGTIETELAIAGSGGLEALREGAARTHPLGRAGQPEEIANAVLFLASEKASFITGEYLCVDGGLMAKGAWQE